MKARIIKFFLETCRVVAEATSDTIHKWQADATQQKKAELAAQAMAIRFQNSAAIQRDLARIMQGMTPPNGLTPITDPRNLTFLPDYNNSNCYFSFWWQKTCGKFPISDTILLSLAKRINQRIQQMPANLAQIGYTYQELAMDYPALYNGFSVSNIQDSNDGVVITIRLY